MPLLPQSYLARWALRYSTLWRPGKGLEQGRCTFGERGLVREYQPKGPQAPMECSRVLGGLTNVTVVIGRGVWRLEESKCVSSLQKGWKGVLRQLTARQSTWPWSLRFWKNWSWKPFPATWRAKKQLGIVSRDSLTNTITFYDEMTGFTSREAGSNGYCLPRFQEGFWCCFY